ncbi:MAG: DUF72 domain-containing protein [Deltaproteobacteria bacterium]|nr:DUF72 domain-containing protein [Deltaproteobacteria bacterium]
MSQRPVDFDPENFRFRGLHPQVFLGTASDRYAAWMGQIYSRERFEKRVATRTKAFSGHTYREDVLPLESVSEYFDHFRTLEIDFTFYQLLLDAEGNPTQSHRVLEGYRRHLAPEDRLLLKVPQVICARKISRGGSHVENPDFLDPDVFTNRFFEPAVALLGSHLEGMIFEQEYHRKQERMTPDAVAEAFDAFFGSIPADSRYHLELRTDSYLSKPVFTVLEKHGVGQVLSHWTWLPPLDRQFAKVGRRVLNAGGRLVVRLLTPAGTRYEEAYAAAYPFDKLVEGMLQPKMIDDTVAIVKAAISQGVRVHVVVNNRAGGNAPLIARLLAERFLESD